MMQILPYLISMILGAGTFFISQNLTRLPLLTLLAGPQGLFDLSLVHPWLQIFILATTAGLFEETGRLIGRRVFYQANDQQGWRMTASFKQALCFGLGHGLFEAIWLLGPLLALYPLSYLSLALFERLLAIIFHMGLSVLIFDGVNQRKSLKYWGIACGLHALADLGVGIFANILLTYSYFILIIALLWWDILRNRRW